MTWDSTWGLQHCGPSLITVVRIEYIFAFQIWYCELCVKKSMKGKQKALFKFLFFLAFSQLNLSWKFGLMTFPFSSLKFQAFFVIIFNNWRKTVIRLVFLTVSTIWTVNYCQKSAIFEFLFLLHFVIIFYSLFSHPLPARPQFLIVLHNSVKQYSPEKGMICDAVSERRIYELPDKLPHNLRLFQKKFKTTCNYIIP